MILAIKKCSKCGFEGTSDLFLKNTNICKSCRKEYCKNYKIKNKGKIKPASDEQKTKYNENRRKVYEENKEEKRIKSKQKYRENIQSILYWNAKRRAKEKNLPFNIEKSDVIIPEYCPILNIKLKVNEGVAKDSSPTLDRIIPSKGYVKGNIQVISYRANTIKNDATIEELEKIINYLRRINE